jgi:hypothetical protein
MYTAFRQHGAAALLFSLAASAAPAQSAKELPKNYAQQLVNDTVAHHADLKGLEIALLTDKGCVTVAATAVEDIGEKCDDDENGPMKTGKPSVEAPSKGDPVYDITQALHDASGTLIGAVGMDIAPEPGEKRAAIVARARSMLRELESNIPSKGKLLEPSPSK